MKQAGHVQLTGTIKESDNCLAGHPSDLRVKLNRKHRPSDLTRTEC